jgi:hypothetical protein
MAIITIIGVAMWANIPLLLWLWTIRIKSPAGPSIRERLGLISLILATASVVVFFGGMGFAPEQATPAFDMWFRHWFRTCLFISAATILFAISGRGKHQWAILISSFITPLSCILQKVLE